ncbi:MAG TPA: oligosaccharide flippase family protein, partial [Thermoanaerobaculia bacterium]|nr:oligosaccharide flippase family protein [Thermoanaerobaculia bacterium]
MQGLQKQVSLNAVNAAMATVRGLGAVLVLWLVAPTVQAFFVWQVTAGLLHTVVLAVALWRSLGGTASAEFSRTLLRSVWHFAAGMTAISVLSSILTQIDKIVVSGALSLEAFGYYAFAGTVAASLYRVITPIFTAIFPRFSQLAARGAVQELAALYHKSAQALTVVIAPAAIFIALFSSELLLLWTRDPSTVAKTHGILSVLILGTAVNGLLSIPYATLLAYGSTRVVVIMNVIAVLILIPGVFHLATRFGPRGAASAWLGYNLAIAVVLPLFLHTRLLRGELARWYLHDIGTPLLVAAAIGAVCRYLVPTGSGDVVSLLVRLTPIALLMQFGATIVVPDVRRRLRVWSPA